MSEAPRDGQPNGGGRGAATGGKRPRTLGELEGHPRNPREISEAARDGLRQSLYVFGDLSGIVWNAATGHLICAHQRREQLTGLDVGRIRWGRAHDVTLGYPRQRFTSPEREGYVTLADGARFHVRQVDWPDEEFEKAALLTANNPNVMGDFTDEARELLGELRQTVPDLTMEVLALDDLLDDLLDDDAEDEDAPDDGGAGGTVADVYQVVVECVDEAEQQTLYDRLKREGKECHLLVL